MYDSLILDRPPSANGFSRGSVQSVGILMGAHGPFHIHSGDVPHHVSIRLDIGTMSGHATTSYSVYSQRQELQIPVQAITAT